jgi:predicted TIM-barrel fold metal-dependent hydrolase
VSAREAIDGFVTPLPWPPGQEPSYVQPLLSKVFGLASDAVFVDRAPEELIAEMDDAGIAIAILNALPGRVAEIAAWVDTYPERFRLSVEFDPRDGMAAVREIRRLHAHHGLTLVRMVPFAIGLAPNAAAYYPLFATCVDLGIAASVTCGMPAVPMPADVQRPIHLDDVCRYFPELTLIMAHGADPWWTEAIRLMMRFPHLYMMTSDWSPRRLPRELIDYLNHRGRHKIMFATGYPALAFSRCRAEAAALDLAPGVLPDFVTGNATRIFDL